MKIDASKSIKDFNMAIEVKVVGVKKLRFRIKLIILLLNIIKWISPMNTEILVNGI